MAYQEQIEKLAEFVAERSTYTIEEIAENILVIIAFLRGLCYTVTNHTPGGVYDENDRIL